MQGVSLKRMSANEVLVLLEKVQWHFGFFFCVVLGTFSRECAGKVFREDRGHKKLFFEKMVISFVICILFHGYYSHTSWDKTNELYWVILASLLSADLMKWVIKDLPMLLIDFIISKLNNLKK